MSVDIGAARERLLDVEAALGRMPAWKAGSPGHTRLAQEAARLRRTIDAERLRRRYVVPDGRGAISRYRLAIPGSQPQVCENLR